MKKRRSSKATKSTPGVKKVQSVEKIDKLSVDTKIDNSNKTMWKVDEVKLDLNEQSPAKETTIEFRDALAKSIIDQTDLGIKENIESIKPENLDNLVALIPRDRHLLVPINVQALVVPSTDNSTKKDKTKSNQGLEISTNNNNNNNNPKLKQIPNETFAERAGLKTEFRESNANSDNKEYWGIPEAFDYTSSNPRTTGLKTGIHLFWSLPNALLDGEPYDLLITDDAGTKSRIVEGIVSVTPGTTQT